MESGGHWLPEFAERFEKRYGTRPTLDIATVPSFDIAELLVDFVEKYQGDFESATFREALRNYFYGINKYDGASGVISVDNDGATRSLSFATYEIRDGRSSKIDR